MVTIIKKGANKLNIQKALDNLTIKKGIQASKYCGKIKLAKDPLIIQKNLRDEWK